MKVIIIKDCKDGKVNQIVDVSDGYAKNFLIKNKLALPVNANTKNALDKKIKEIKELNDQNIAAASKLKKELEEVKLSFLLKSTNLVVHGSVSKKQIINELSRLGFKIDVHAIAQVHINSFGTTIVPINLHKEVIANLKVEVKRDE